MKKNKPIAIVSKAFRFPQYIQTDESFWNILKNKKCVITQVPEKRWPVQELTHSTRSEAGRSVTFAAGIIPNADAFDASFFGISPREAAKMDPQQRLLLMLTHEAFENANTPSKQLSGSNCGVYLGISSLDYGMQHIEDLSSMTLHSMTGNTMSVAANRLSYVFNLHGPSLAIDTACSSSLVALHAACAALQNEEIPCALVGGVNLLMHPYSFVGFSKASMISAEGRCLPFDAKGAGYVRAEGAAMLYLKPLEKALADNDPIEAVICGTGVNTDGKRKSGLTIPSVQGQVELMQNVLKRTGIAPESIDFVEMHGTGTPVGDPIEAEAVSTVYAQKRTTPLPISSVKANVGHMEPASGMAGLIKTLLVLKHRQIPSAPFAFEPNPHIAFNDLNIEYIASKHAYALKNTGTLCAAVNSFGFGGANAHVILQSPEEYVTQKTEQNVLPAKQSSSPLILSARTSHALKALAQKYAKLYETAHEDAAYDIAYAAATQRDFFEKRVAFMHPNPKGMAEALHQYAQNTACSDIEGLCVEQNIAVFHEDSAQEPSSDMASNNIAFIYCGNGAHWVGMGKTLLEQSTDFAQCMTELDDLMQSIAHFPLKEHLYNATQEDLENTAIVQPLIFAIQVGITHLLAKQDIHPAAVAGHSVGEVVAGYVAGAYDLKQAIHIISARSQCQALTAGLGRMAAIKMTAQKAQDLITQLNAENHIFIAGINALEHLTLSGSEEHLHKIQEYCQDKNIYFQILPLNYAFHSPHMDGIEKILLEKIQGISLQQEKKALFVSTVTGTVLNNKDLHAHYWWDNVRKPVLFAPAMESLLNMGMRIFVEIGPHAILQRYIKDCISAKQLSCAVYPTMLRKNDSPIKITETALRICLATSHPKVQHFFQQQGEPVTLPNYAWQTETYWLQPTSDCLPAQRCVHQLLGWPVFTGDNTDKIWENTLDARTLPWLKHHMVGDAIVFPAAGYVELALAMGKTIFTDTPYAIESLDIIAPLIIEENTAQKIRCHVDIRSNTFKITARPRLSDTPWMVYAAGQLAEQTFLQENASLYIPPLEEHAQLVPYAKKDLYDTALSLGLEYGELFQSVENLHLYNKGLYGEIHLNEETWQEYILAPAALDACFHALVAFIAQQETMNTQASLAFLPVKTEQVAVFQQKPITNMHVHIERISNRSVLAHCALYATDKSLVALATGCRFRAAPLVQKKSLHVDTWHMEPSIKPLPRTTALAMPSIEELLADWPQKKCVNYGQWREKWFSETLPLLELLSLAYGAECLQNLQEQNTAQFHQALQSPYGQWLLQILIEQDIACKKEDVWFFDQSQMPSGQELWQQIAQKTPEAFAHLLPLGRVGLRLKDTLLQENALQELQSAVCQASVTKNLRAQDPNMQTMAQTLQSLVLKIIEKTDAHACVRIVEIGAFSWGLAQSLYAHLPTERFHYTFACTEEDSLQQSNILFTKYTNYTAIALQEDWNAQKLTEHGGYDIVIVQQSLHTQAHLSNALDMLKQCLLPKGLLCITECYAHWHSNFIHGLHPTWWRLQKQSALLSPTQWQALLTEKGFEHCQYKNEAQAEDLHAGAYILLAQKAAEQNTPSPDHAAGAHKEQQTALLLLGDNTAASFLQPLQKQCEQNALSVHTYFTEKNTGFEEHIHSFLAAHAHEQACTLIFCHGIGQDPCAAAHSLEILRHVACTLEAKKASNLRLIILTQAGALCPAPTLNCAQAHYSPTQAALWGMGRVIMNEFADFQCSLVDCPYPQSKSTQAQKALGNALLPKLWQEIFQSDGTDEIILTKESRQQLLLQQSNSMLAAQEKNTSRYKLDMTQPGKLTNLRWAEDQERSVKEGQVEVQVMATGLNFRDIMLTLGLLPDDAVENGFAGPTLGLEFSGIVSQVGPKVANLRVGDAVVGFAPSCFSSHVITDADVLAPMPSHWRFENAASVPTVFFTAYYALKHLAQMQEGESLLIHGAAGGVGLAAIQIAKYLGVEIFATAGSEEKRDLLRLHGIEHIFDSRSLDFVEQIRAVTKGKGVDVVLNSLAGEAMRRSIGLLRPFGRFVELGKRDFVENTPIHLRPFKENISYFAFDADQMLTAKPAVSKKIFSEIMQLFEQNIFQVLPVRIFDAHHTLDAFRAMQQAQHIGKIVVSLRTPPKQCITTSPSAQWKGHGTWLITGGLEGFGLASAQWLVEQGAEQLILVSRRGMQSPKAQEVMEFFSQKGISVHIKACDVSQQDAVTALFASLRDIQPPLTGIMHSATVYNDAFLQELSHEKLQSVLAPKLQGAWNLHKASLDLPKESPLEHFVLFSSISVSLGNMGQANYVAANAGLESLALLRQSMGLGVTCVAWGPIGDVGYLTEHEKVKNNLEKHMGTEVLHSQKALNALHSCLLSQKAVHIIANVDWQTLRRALPYEASRYAQVFQSMTSAYGGHDDGENRQNIRTLLSDKSPQEALDIICAILIQELAGVLSLDPQNMEKNSTLQALGMDSLMAVELALSLEQRFGIRLPTMLLQDTPSIEKVSSRIFERLTSKNQEESPVDAMDTVQELAMKHGETFNDEELQQITQNASKQS